MSQTQSSDTAQYTSWIKLVEKAERTIAALKQRTSLVTIDDKDNVDENSVIIFDTSRFSE